MQNKIKNMKRRFLLAAALAAFVSVPSFAADTAGEDEQAWADEISAGAVAEYDASGTLFQKIADLEQEKVLMQLEKERAQLDLELDRLAAEKIKLHMEIDTLSGRAEEQQKALDVEKAKLEAETAKLEREKQSLLDRPAETSAKKSASPAKAAAREESESGPISAKYRLIEIIGAGNQLQATVEDTQNGQRRKISVGRVLEGYTVRSISLDDGVVFVKDGEIQTLNIGKEK
jgi:type IV pilus biogenesis protein PilP